MYFSVDRIIQGTATLIGEDKKPLDVPERMLPPGTKEGDMLLYEQGVFHSAPLQTAERRERVADMLARLLHSNADDSEDE